MNKQSSYEPWLFPLIAWSGRTLAVLFSVAMLSIMGYMLIGGVVGTIGLMLKLDWLAHSAPPLGWLAGATAGLFSGIGKFVLPFLSKRPADSKPAGESPAADGGEEEAELPQGERRFVWPRFTELLKTTGLLTLIGGGLGIMCSAYLAIVLISVTTSPFVPSSWRPGTAAYVAEEDDPVGSHRRHESPGGVSAGTSFYHPLLGPIVGYTVVPMLALGFVAGIGFSFFPDASDSA